jgi:hypothetical protein
MSAVCALIVVGVITVAPEKTVSPLQSVASIILRQ